MIYECGSCLIHIAYTYGIDVILRVTNPLMAGVSTVYTTRPYPLCRNDSEIYYMKEEDRENFLRGTEA